MMVSSDRIVALLCREKPVLAELREAFPESWEKVYAELRDLAEYPDPARIAASLTQADYDWRQMQPQCLRLQKVYDRRIAEKCGLFLIRKIALEQYSRAMQQEAIKAYGAIPLGDRLLTRLLIEPMAKRILPYRRHRRVWRLLKNPAAATAHLMRSGCYLIAPKELIRELRGLIGDRPALEIGAGRGILAGGLRHAGVDITAVDDFSWADRLPMGRDVLQLDGREALRRFKPPVVVCSWPPPGNLFEQEIFACPEVEDYIVIVSRHRHASGNHQAYASAAGFRCVQATGLLAQMLLPVEAESVLYIFSRKNSAGAPPASDLFRG
jgi:hypothetical protein